MDYFRMIKTFSHSKCRPFGSAHLWMWEVSVTL